MSSLLHLLAHWLAGGVLQSLIEGSLIGGFAALVLVVSRYNANTRFAVWFSSLIAIAALPILGAQWLWKSPTSAADRAVIRVPESWAFYLAAFWALFAGCFLLRIAKSLLHLRRLRRSCVEVDPASLGSSLQETLLRQGFRHVVLCTSNEVRVPTALGLIRPAIVIPEWAMQELSADELNQILLHELAHFRRWDDWTNLLQQLLKAILFFHPVVWWIDQKVALEREIACDDAVIAETADPRAYAECLAHLAEKSFMQRSLTLAQAALGRIRQTTLRVTSILDPNRPPQHSRALKPAVTLVALFTLGCGVWAGRTSGLIALKQSAPGRTMQASAAPEPSAAAGRESDPRGLTLTPASTHSEVRPAKLNLGAACPYPRKAVHQAVLKQRLDLSKPRVKEVLQRTNGIATAAPVTETLFVVIESRGFDPGTVPVYQIQTWHILVLRTVVDPNLSQPSRKI